MLVGKTIENQTANSPSSEYKKFEINVEAPILQHIVLIVAFNNFGTLAYRHIIPASVSVSSLCYCQCVFMP